VDEGVGLRGGEALGVDAEGAADSACAAAAAGKDVYDGVADHGDFGGVEGGLGAGGKDCVGFGDQGEEAVGVGLLGGEGVAAVVLEEEGGEVELAAEFAGGRDGLVGEDGHEEVGVRGADGFEGGEDAGVGEGVVELVEAVPGDEVVVGLAELSFVMRGGIKIRGVAEGPADEHGGAVSDVAGDDCVWEWRLAHVGEHGVD